jgi:hypothetical protein
MAQALQLKPSQRQLVLQSPPARAVENDSNPYERAVSALRNDQPDTTFAIFADATEVYNASTRKHLTRLTQTLVDDQTLTPSDRARLLDRAAKKHFFSARAILHSPLFASLILPFVPPLYLKEGFSELHPCGPASASPAWNLVSQLQHMPLAELSPGKLDELVASQNPINDQDKQLITKRVVAVLRSRKDEIAALSETLSKAPYTQAEVDGMQKILMKELEQLTAAFMAKGSMIDRYNASIDAGGQQRSRQEVKRARTHSTSLLNPLNEEMAKFADIKWLITGGPFRYPMFRVGGKIDLRDPQSAFSCDWKQMSNDWELPTARKKAFCERLDLARKQQIAFLQDLLNDNLSITPSFTLSNEDTPAFNRLWKEMARPGRDDPALLADLNAYKKNPESVAWFDQQIADAMRSI